MPPPSTTPVLPTPTGSVRKPGCLGREGNLGEVSQVQGVGGARLSWRSGGRRTKRSRGAPRRARSVMWEVQPRGGARGRRRAVRIRSTSSGSEITDRMDSGPPHRAQTRRSTSNVRRRREIQSSGRLRRRGRLALFDAVPVGERQAVRRDGFGVAGGQERGRRDGSWMDEGALPLPSAGGEGGRGALGVGRRLGLVVRTSLGLAARARLFVSSRLLATGLGSRRLRYHPCSPGVPSGEDPVQPQER